MVLVTRRAFFGSLAAALPIASLACRAHDAAVNELATSKSSMLALGEAILPSELGAAGIAATVKDFQRWIAEYHEGAELLHGYGTSSLKYMGPTPATAWAAQLDALDRTAKRTQGRSFAALPVESRRSLVRSDLDTLKLDRIPPVSRAPHVAVAMLAHYYESSEATDRCYEAHIGRETCRPLAAQARKPLPLAPAGA